MSTGREHSFPRAEPSRLAAALAFGVVLLTISWALLHSGFWTKDRIVDTPVYERYGEAVVDGQVPYRDFRLEYPPAALPVFVLPALTRSEDYEAVFELCMWACAVGALIALGLTLDSVGAGSVRLFSAVTFVALAPLAVGSMILSRYDLWPAALTIAALAALVRGRERLGLGILALAVAAKLYPFVLLPLALVWTAKRRGSRDAGIAFLRFFAVLAACYLPFLILSPGGVAHSIGGQLDRPLQIESLGASLLLAAHQLGLYQPTVVTSHGSQNLAGPLPDALAVIQTPVQAAMIALTWVLYATRRRGAEGLLLASAAAVAAFVAFGKVLSPQFVIWLLPLVPAVAGATGLAATGLFAVALVTTQLWFPFRYWDVVDLEPAGWLVLVRDLLLVALCAVLLLALSRRRRAGSRSE